MIIDARSISPGEALSADLCIVGAGAAGITIAKEMLGTQMYVIVLEAGGLKLEQESQELYQGAAVGHPYFSLDACRHRYLGGSTNHWGGWCRPLDPIDFEKKPWIPHSGWPFSKPAIDNAYARAIAVLGLNKALWEKAAYDGIKDQSLPCDQSSSVIPTVIGISPMRFGRQFRDSLRQANNVKVILHGTAIELLFEKSQNIASGIRVATSPGNCFSVKARAYVLASGGIENARILLSSTMAHASGVGNDYDLVGRYFMEHLCLPVGIINAAATRQHSYLVGTHKIRSSKVRHALTFPEEVIRRHQLLGFAATLHDADDRHDLVSFTDEHKGYGSFAFLAHSALRGELPDRPGHHMRQILSDLTGTAKHVYAKLAPPPMRRFLVVIRSEQIPSPNNRILLKNERDALGMPKIQLNWQPTEEDLRNIELCTETLARECLWPEISKSQCPASGDADGRVGTVRGNSHHLGTTRMHKDPTNGVVDENCRVHGCANLFVAGGSVFPAAGWSNPTLTLVALAIRLSDHIKQALHSGLLPNSP